MWGEFNQQGQNVAWKCWQDSAAVLYQFEWPWNGLWPKPGQSKPIPRGLPGGPVVRTWGFHCWGPGFNPWLGNWDPTILTAKIKQIKTCPKDLQSSSETCPSLEVKLYAGEQGAVSCEVQGADAGSTAREEQGKACFLPCSQWVSNPGSPSSHVAHLHPASLLRLFDPPNKSPLGQQLVQGVHEFPRASLTNSHRLGVETAELYFLPIPEAEKSDILVSGLVSPEASSLASCCGRLGPNLFFKGHQSYWMRAHSKDLF